MNITVEHTDSGRSDPVFRVIKKRGKLTLDEVQQQCNEAADRYGVQFFCCVFRVGDGFRKVYESVKGLSGTTTIFW